MDKWSAVLAIVHLAGEKLQGRTALQKLVYFATRAGLADYRFEPHYYGPYADELTATIQGLISLQLLKEDVTSLGPQTDPWLKEVSGDVKVYSYSLTPDGKQIVDGIQKELSEEWKKLEWLVTVCRRHTQLRPHTLSATAKVAYIFSQQAETQVSNEKIAETANELGWTLAEGEIQIITSLLQELQLVPSRSPSRF
jgi:uncharacterized protein YwgA